MKSPRGTMQFEIAAPTRCPKCRLAPVCGAEGTAHECPPESAKRVGGEYSLSIHDPNLKRFEKALRGLTLCDVEITQSAHRLELPFYVAELKFDSRLNGIRPRSVFAVRLGAVMTKSGTIKRVPDVQAHLGLPASTKMLLLCTDEDDLLEEFDRHSPRIIHDCIQAGYAAFVAPSFSTYDNRDRPEYLVNTKRSLVSTQAFCEMGALAIPPIGLNIESDARRFASWILRNPGIHTVALDLMNEFKQHKLDTLPIARLLDKLTGGRLRFVVVGASSASSFEQVFSYLDPRRVVLTNASTATVPPLPGLSKSATFDHLVRAQVGEISRLKDEWIEANDPTDYPLAA